MLLHKATFRFSSTLVPFPSSSCTYPFPPHSLLDPFPYPSTPPTLPPAPNFYFPWPTCPLPDVTLSPPTCPCPFVIFPPYPFLHFNPSFDSYPSRLPIFPSSLVHPAPAHPSSPPHPCHRIINSSLRGLSLFVNTLSPLRVLHVSCTCPLFDPFPANPPLHPLPFQIQYGSRQPSWIFKLPKLF